MQDLIRIGQVGLGYWGKNLLRNFSSVPGAAVTHLCDEDRSRLERLKATYPDAKTATKFETMLDDGNLDAVVVATDTPGHYPLALAALRAGKHVFVEKPMAETAEQAETLVKSARDAGVRLMVGHLLLYHPAFRYVEQLIRTGDLGEIYYLYSVRVNLGVVRRRESAFESLAPHDISVALAFIDDRPVSVAAQGQSYLQKGIEDVAFAVIHFENGRMAHLHTSWLDPHKVRKVTVVGSRMMAVIDDVEGVEKVRLYDKGVDLAPTEATFVDFASAMTIRSGDIRIPKVDMTEPLAEECAHFVACCRTGDSPRTDGANGLAVVRIMEAAMRSMREGGARIDISGD